MPLTYLAMLFSFLVAINYPANRSLGPSILLSREEEDKGSHQKNSDSIWRSGVKAQAGTDVNTLEQKAGISLNKTRVGSSYAFTLRRLTARLVNGTYVDISSLLHTAIGRRRQGWPFWYFSFHDDATFCKHSTWVRVG